MKKHEQGLVSKVIKGYNDFNYSIVLKMISESEGVNSEYGFLGNGYIQKTIKQLQGEIGNLSKSIELNMKHNDQTRLDQKELMMLMERQKEMYREIAFIASNDWAQLEQCLNVVKGDDWAFIDCLKALKLYHSNEHQAAFDLFYPYFSKLQGTLEHYLVNKTYGALLLEFQQYDISKIFLLKAIALKPEDIVLHQMMVQIYDVLGDSKAKAIELEIISLLGGV